MNNKSDPKKIPVHAIMNVGFIKMPEKEADIEDNERLEITPSKKTSLRSIFWQFAANIFSKDSTTKSNQ